MAKTKVKCGLHPPWLRGENEGEDCYHHPLYVQGGGQDKAGGIGVGPLQLCQGVETTLLLEHVTLMLMLVLVPNERQR